MTNEDLRALIPAELLRVPFKSSLCNRTQQLDRYALRNIVGRDTTLLLVYGPEYTCWVDGLYFDTTYLPRILAILATTHLTLCEAPDA